MAYEIQNPQISLVAGADLTGAQYKAVKLDSSGNIVLCGADESGIGILQDNPALGAAGTVWMYGVSKGQYGGTVAKGASVSTDAAGKFVTAGSGAIWGVSLTGGTATTLGNVAMATRASVGGSSRSGGNIISIPISLVTLTAAGDYTVFTPGFIGTIAKVQFAVGTAVVAASRAATISLKIAGVAVTGGAVALTSANSTANAVIAGSAVTLNNTFTAAQAITVTASSVTAFAEGQGVLLISVI